MEERRKYQRVNVDLPAQYKFPPDPLSSFISTVVNISAEGVCFISQQQIRSGQDVELQVDLDTSEQVSFKEKDICQ